MFSMTGLDKIRRRDAANRKRSHASNRREKNYNCSQEGAYCCFRQLHIASFWDTRVALM